LEKFNRFLIDNLLRGFSYYGKELNLKNPYKALSKINPQQDKGNRQIANDVYDALVRAKLSGSEYQIILFIIGKTWGFRKHSDGISYSQITEKTGLTRPGAINTMKKLEQKRIIVVDRKVVKGSLPVNEYLFNKHYDTWLNISSKQEFTSSKVVNGSILVNKQNKTGKQMKQKLVNHSLHTKESLTKETLQKKEPLVANQNHLRLVSLLKTLILQNDPKAKIPKDITKWIDPIDKLERIDGRSPEEIARVIQFSQADDFWKANILSTNNLRKHFGQLLLKARKSASSDGLTDKNRRSLSAIANLNLGKETDES